ncbi:protein singed-like [Paramacrobiotus metropolitanus]|uniref:protein singed-like n=1 Tax=Paramacrobiotus metropolitanus TaxID=2943436 RepID=UPI002445FAFE|nr:protein singed-like [Paramacrobiotus metropolitanus]
MTAIATNGFRHLLKPVSATNGHSINKGVTMHVNGNGHPMQQPDDKLTFTWNVGLINSKNHYLTAETFGNKVNVTGTSLRKKQFWTLIPGRDINVIALKSHLGKYLSIDQYGNVTCEAEHPGDGEYFTILEADDHSGRWALRNEKSQYFLSGDGEKLSGTSRLTVPNEFWTIHMSIHPVCTLRNIGRKRYARARGDEIQCDQDVPWGQESLLTLEFIQQRYVIKTYSGLYLNNHGKLVPDISPATLFTVVFYGGQAALRDNSGKFLSPFGNEATLRCKNPNISKAELFILEHAQPQCSLLARNGRVVSMRQGVDLSANQDSVSENEIFQLECDKSSKCWRLRTCLNKYWCIQGSSHGIQANGDAGSDESGFELVWMGDGKVSLKSVKNGKFVLARPTGHLFAQSDSVDTAEQFQLLISNRPIIGLRSVYGFVGLKTATSTKLECNKSSIEPIRLENAPSGAIYLQGPNGLYLNVGDDQVINSDAKEPRPFFIQFRESGRITLKAPNGRYAVPEQNGLFKASADEHSAAEWEY